MRWDWPKQTIFGFGKEESANAPVGNCFQCCIAAMLQIPAEEVPHFALQAQQNNRSASTIAAKWLAERGYWFVTVDGSAHWGGLSSAAYLYRYADDNVPDMPMICGGPTVRSKTWRFTHVVIMAGEKLLYDPHPSEAGLLAITHTYLIVPFYAAIKQTRLPELLQ